MGKLPFIYAIMNHSYGEIILVTPSKEVRDATIRDELLRYGYDDEGINAVQAGEFDDDPITWQSVAYQAEMASDEEEEEEESKEEPKPEPPVMGVEIDGILFRDNEEPLTDEDVMAMIEEKGILFGGFTKPVDVNS